MAIEANEMGSIQLNECNTVMGKLHCGSKFDIVVDSGATITLISTEVIDKSIYLKSLPLIPTNPIKIRIADGSHIHSSNKIRFKVTIQEYEFILNAQVMPTFGLVKALLGTKDLRDMKAKLDFTTNKLEFSLVQDAPFRLLDEVVIRPGSRRTVTLISDLPKNANSGEVVLNCSEEALHLTSSCLLATVEHGVCSIPFFNDTDTPYRLQKGSIMAYVDVNATQSRKLPCEVEESHSVLHIDYNPQLAKVARRNLSQYPFLEDGDPKVSMTEEEILRNEVDLGSACILDEGQKQQ
jgi:hypothetical protein